MWSHKKEIWNIHDLIQTLLSQARKIHEPREGAIREIGWEYQIRSMKMIRGRGRWGRGKGEGIDGGENMRQTKML